MDGGKRRAFQGALRALTRARPPCVPSARRTARARICPRLTASEAKLRSAPQESDAAPLTHVICRDLQHLLNTGASN